ncbi:hypothetical protein Tco_1288021 [Tanacetum coccineum]
MGLVSFSLGTGLSLVRDAVDEGGDGEVLNGFLLGKGRMVIMVGVMVVVWWRVKVGLRWVVLCWACEGGGDRLVVVDWCDEVVVTRKIFEEMCMVICEDRTDLGYDLGGDNVFV